LIWLFLVVCGGIASESVATSVGDIIIKLGLSTVVMKLFRTVEMRAAIDRPLLTIPSTY
jgi:hypothetical protein